MITLVKIVVEFKNSKVTLKKQRKCRRLESNTLLFYILQHWECRLFFSLFQYVLTASYIWIFVEGLYLHMLIFVSVFTEKTRVLWYMVFGWCKYKWTGAQVDPDKSAYLNLFFFLNQNLCCGYKK